jgi:hypothetical protein
MVKFVGLVLWGGVWYFAGGWDGGDGTDEVYGRTVLLSRGFLNIFCFI